MQGRLLFLSPFPPPQKRILKSTVFWIFILSCIIGVCSRLKIKQVWRIQFTNLQRGFLFPSRTGSPYCCHTQGSVTHNSKSPQKPSGILEEVLICTCHFVNVFLSYFQQGLQRVLLSLSTTTWKLLAYLSCEKDVEMVIKRQHWVISYSLQELV